MKNGFWGVTVALGLRRRSWGWWIVAAAVGRT
jgi:hypothetical protein